jgi:HAD superfamily hydrolase (TIGR01509 family)
MMTDSMHLLKDHLKSIQAVIFDMDGVLIDSEKHHFIAHKEALSEFGANIDKTFYIAHGISTDPALFYARAFKKELLPNEYIDRILQRKIEIYKKLLEEEEITPIKQAIDLVHLLYEKKISIAICSAVSRPEVERNLQILELDGLFKVIVAGGDFPLRNKPFPDIYLKAAELLCVRPTHCMAIEDSVSGAQAALIAGMLCVVVPNDYTKSQNFPGSAAISSFPEISSLMVDS